MSILQSLRSYVVKKPIKSWLSFVLSLSWISLFPLLLNNLPLEPGLLIVNYIGLLGGTFLIIQWTRGTDGRRKLIKQILHWRVHIVYYIFALAALPVMTILLSFLLGSLVPPQDWGKILFGITISLLSGFLIINLWEETGWTGFMQAKLMKERGLLYGSVLTAPAFVAIHLPLFFQTRDTNQILIDILVVLGLSFFFRYLIGMLFLDTKGSLFLVGLLHASFNSASGLAIVNGHSEIVFACIIVTIIYFAYRKILKKSDTFPKDLASS